MTKKRSRIHDRPGMVRVYNTPAPERPDATQPVGRRRSMRAFPERPAQPPRRGRAPAVLAGTAAALAGAALYNTVQAMRTERAHLPSGSFIRVDGVNLHYIDRGEGPAVLLLHGNVVDAEDWIRSGIANWLVAKGLRVLAFDRPGFGFSDRPHDRAWTAAEQAELIHAALSRLDIGRVAAVGHSWGTLAALELALRHPDAVSGLVLLSGYYRPAARLDVPLVALDAVPVLGDLLRYTLSPFVTAALLPLTTKAMFAPRAVPQRFSEDFPHGFPLRPWQIRAEAQDAASMKSDAAALQDRYAELRMPVTILAGAEDRIVDHVAHALWLHGRIPRSVRRVLPRTGHMLHYAVPDQVAAAVEDVMTGQGRPGVRPDAGEPHALVPEG
ncbi:alpha/beta fold hydrolase [Arenibaculum pallidiluteum]|uniref:alpha/beta fold hydrolase n=1 Tax=Arenibaculum pallidiluteum TaxID=2812559 RepID=UPI001F29C71B|nr:alpha/beta hydrolase [Arenibaculum pallidiluteum]